MEWEEGEGSVGGEGGGEKRVRNNVLKNKNNSRPL